MKKFFSLFVVMLVSVAMVSAQEIEFEMYESGDATKTSNTAEETGADMTQPGTNAKEWNYGTIDNGTTGYRFFKFKNTGNAPLVISSAKGSCGCTVPKWPSEPILPGESNFIKVKYDTKRTGAFTKYVTLTTNAKNSSTTRLKIYGTVNAPKSNKTATPDRK